MPDILSALQSISGVPENQQVSRDQLVRAVQDTAPSVDGYNTAASMDMGLTFPDQIINRYNPNYNAVMNARRQGYNQYIQDANAYSEDGVLADSLNAITNALHGGLRTVTDAVSASVGIPADIAFAIAGSDAQPSVALSNALSGTVDDIAEAMHTDAYNRRQQALNAQANAQLRDSEYQYNRDIRNGDSSLAATGKQILRDIGNWADRQTSYDVLMSGSEVAGQAVTQGLLIKKGAALTGKASKLVSDSVRKFANRIKTPAVIGLTEASANMVDTANRISEMSYEELEQNSPVFPSLVQENLNKGMSLNDAKESARNTLAGMVARRNFAYTLPPAILAGRLSSAGVERPFSAVTRAVGNTSANTLGGAVRRTIGNATDAAGILGEATEETLQGISGTLAQQLIDQSLVNRNQRIGQGLGDVIAESATGGAIGRAITSLPGSTIRATADIERGTANTLGTVANTVGNTINTTTANMERNRNIRKMQDSINDINTNGSEALKKDIDVSNEVFSKANIDPNNSDGTRKNVVEAFTELSNKFNNAAQNYINKQDSKQPITTDELLQGLEISEQYRDFIESTFNKDAHRLEEDTKDLSAEDKAKLEVFKRNSKDQLDAANENINEFSSVLKQHLKDNINNSEIINSSAARRAIRKFAASALDKLDSEDVETLKKFVVNFSKAEGMSEQELSSWNSIINIIDNYKKLQETTSEQRGNTSLDEVTDQYFTSEDSNNYSSGLVSANQLIQDMVRIAGSDEFNAGNEAALNNYKNKLNNLKLLFTIANNKSKALLKSYNNRNPNNNGYSYQSYRAKDKAPYEAHKIYVNRDSANSLNTFKTIVDGQRDLFTLYNNFIDAFPKAVTTASRNIPARLDSSSLVQLPSDFNQNYSRAESRNKQNQRKNNNVNAAPRNGLDDGTYVNNSDIESPSLSDIALRANEAFVTKFKGESNKNVRKIIRGINNLKAKGNLTAQEATRLHRWQDTLRNTLSDEKAPQLDEDVKEFIINPNEDYLPSRTRKIKEDITSGSETTIKESSSDTNAINIPERSIEDVIKTAGAVYKADNELVQRYSKGDSSISKDTLKKIEDKQFQNEKDIKAKKVKAFNTLSKVILSKLFRTRENSNSIYNKGITTASTINNVYDKILSTIEDFKSKYSEHTDILNKLDSLQKRITRITDLSDKDSPIVVFMQQLQNTLTKQLNTKSNKDLLNNYAASTILTQNRTRVLNFTNMAPNGDIIIDPNVAMVTTLSAIEFINELNNYIGNKDLDQISDEYNIPIGDLTQEQIDILVNGANTNTLITAFTNKLMNHFGYSNTPGSRPGADGKALMSSLSLLAMQSLQDLGVIQRHKIDITTSDGRTISRNIISLAPDLYGADSAAIQSMIQELESQGRTPNEIANNEDIIKATGGNRWYQSARFYGIEKKIIVDALDSSMDKREFFMDEEMPDVNTITKLHSKAKYTKREKESIEGHRKTKYFLNRPFYTLLRKLGSGNIINLLAIDAKQFNNGLFNINTKKTIEGKRRTVFNSYINNMDRAMTLNIMTSGSEEPGYIRIDYRMTRNGRFQERLAYGPSADKLSRQLFSPERTLIDTNDPEQLYRYNLALIQAFDIKIKEIDSEGIGRDVVNSLANQIRNIITNHKTYSWFLDANSYNKKITAEDIQDLFNEIGNSNNYDETIVYKGKKLVPSSDVTALGLNAILTAVDAIQSVNNPNSEMKGKFWNTLTLEADAPSAGTTNLITMMDSSEEFNGKQIQGARRGGHNIGTNQSFAKYKDFDSTDNYEAAAKIASTKETELVQKNPEVKGLIQDVLNIANIAGLNIQYNDGYFSGSDNAIHLTIPRSVTKDAATPMVYEQQLPSATVSLLTKVGDFIHEHMTNALQAQAQATKDNKQISLAEAFFSVEIADAVNAAPKAEKETVRESAIAKAKQDFEILTTSLNKVAGTKIGTKRDGTLFVDNKRSDLTKANSQFNALSDINQYANFDFFSLIKDRFSNLNQNFQKLLVQSIYDAVNDIRGPGVIQTNRLISTISRTIAMIQQYKAMKFINDYVAEHKYMPTEEEINAKLNESSLNSIYNFSYTNLELSGSTPYNNNAMRVQSLDNDWIFANNIFLPGDPGVSAVPLVTVALSDGAIQREIFRKIQDKIADRYDGSDMGPLSSSEYAPIINKICHDVIMENVLKPFVVKLDENGKQELITLLNQLKNDANSSPDYKAIYDTITSILRMYADASNSRVVGYDLYSQESFLDTDLAINTLTDNLNKASSNLDAKKKVLLQTNTNEQHMVVNEEGYTYVGQNEELNNELRNAPNTSPEDNSNFTAKVMNKYLKRDSSDNIAVREFQDEQVGIIPQTLDQVLTRFDPVNSSLGSFVNRILSSTLDRNIRIYIGTRKQIISLVQNRYPNHAIPSGVQGFQVENDNSIYIIDEGNSTNTTLAHELVHAATVYKLNKLASLNNEEISKLTGKDKAAYLSYLALTDLKNDFRNLIEDSLTKGNIDPAIERELNQAYTHIFEDSSDELTQLKEFIAYVLTTPSIRQYISSQRASSTSTQSTIKSVAARTMLNLKNLFNNVLKYIGNIIGITPRTRNKEFLNFMDAMEYNIASITDYSFIGSENNSSQTILHYISTDEDSRLSTIMKNMDKAVSAAINSRQWNSGYDNTENNRRFLKVLYARDTERDESRFNELIAAAQRAGFILSAQQVQAMKTIMSIYNTSFALNPIIKSESENLRKIVIDKLSSEDFLATSTSPEEAQNKYDFLANMSGMVIKAYQNEGLSRFTRNNRDASLAIFMGLSLVSPEVRDILQNTKITKEEIRANRYPVNTANNSVDEFINNLGTRIVDFISDKTINPPASRTALNIVDNYIASINASSIDYSVLDLPNMAANNIEKAVTDKLVSVLNKSVNSDVFQRLLKDEDSSRLRHVLLGALYTGVNLISANTEYNDNKTITDIFKKLNAFAVKHPNALGRFIITSAKELLPPDKSLNDLFRTEKEIKSEVQIKRQVYRENMPRIILEEFSKEGISLSKNDTRILNTAYNKCDMGALNADEIHQVLTSDYELSRLQSKLEDEVGMSVSSGSIKDTILKKSEQLANYMLTGVAGPNLLRNADAIAYLLNERYTGRITNEKALITAIDKLVTVYALRNMTSKNLQRTRQIYKQAPKATNYAISQQRALRTKEQYDARTGTNLRFNYYKGYTPYSNKNGASVLVIKSTELGKYEEMGYVKSGDYHGPRIENTSSLIYVTNSVNPRMSFSQGALQSAINLAGGVDTTTGYSVNNIAGRIINPYVIGQYKNRLRLDGGREAFSPVFNDRGQIIALERTVDPSVLNAIKSEDNFAQVIGNWAGRQIEESTAEELNEELLKQLKENLDNASSEELKGYVDLYERAKKDPIIRDALNMLSPITKRNITKIFGNKFMVREDMIDDVIGHRRASIVDSYTGASRLSPATQRAVREITRKVLGEKAFVKLYRGERFLMNTVATARNWIVVRSLSVMYDNLVSNVFQLLVRGVPITSLIMDTPKLLKEIETYNNYRRTLTKLEADLQAAKGSSHYNQYQINKINNDIKATREAIESQSIYPLIAAGEYNTIADIGDTEDDLDLSMGRWGDYIERKVDSLPDNLKIAGKYLLITKDTALYRGLEKGVQYGDFIAKALLYKHLTQKRGYSNNTALDIIRYEFVNYDMLAGRTREFLENIGAIWFYNFKLRTSRVALSMLRHNPLHALLFLNAPITDGLGSPLTDNIFSKVLSGGILGSIGPGLGLDFFLKNMWGQMFL